MTYYRDYQLPTNFAPMYDRALIAADYLNKLAAKIVRRYSDWDDSCSAPYKMESFSIHHEYRNEQHVPYAIFKFEINTSNSDNEWVDVTLPLNPADPSSVTRYQETMPPDDRYRRVPILSNETFDVRLLLQLEDHNLNVFFELTRWLDHVLTEAMAGSFDTLYYNSMKKKDYE